MVLILVSVAEPVVVWAVKKVIEAVTDAGVDTALAGVVEPVSTGDAEAVDDPVLVAADDSAVDGVVVDKREIVDDPVLLAVDEGVADGEVVDMRDTVRVVRVIGELDGVLDPAAFVVVVKGGKESETGAVSGPPEAVEPVPSVGLDP